MSAFGPRDLPRSAAEVAAELSGQPAGSCPSSRGRQPEAEGTVLLRGARRAPRIRTRADSPRWRAKVIHPGSRVRWSPPARVM